METKSRWQQYKEKLGEVKPWDVLDKNVEKANIETTEKRYTTCLECPELIQLTKQCKKCGCFMPLKTKLTSAVCPIGKW